jgi:hypothetical protein
MRHRIVSRRTSLVAIAEEPSMDPLAPRRREKLALELPWGVSADGVGLTGRMGAFQAPKIAGTTLLARHIPLAEVRESDAIDATMLDQLRGDGRSPAGKAQHVVVSILRVENDVVEIEVEMPFTGIPHPIGEIDVRLESGPAIAVLVPERSASATVSAKGARVRLAFRLKDGSPWPRAEIVLLWTGQQRQWGRLKPRTFGAFFVLAPSSDPAATTS